MDKLRAVLMLLSLSGCAEVLDVPDAPHLVEAVTEAGPWSCLATGRKAATGVRVSATVRVTACNFVSTNCNERVTGLMGTLCDKRDVGCRSPIQAGMREVNGEFEFDVRTDGALGIGFDGYMQIRAPTELCTNEAVFGPGSRALCAMSPTCNPNAPGVECRVPLFAPSLLFFNPPIVRDFSEPMPLPLVPTAAIAPIAQAAGVSTLDPTKGFVFVTVRDCEGRPAAGVTLVAGQSQDSLVPLYVDHGVISHSSTVTDASGLAGFMGVSQGVFNVHGVLPGPTPQLIGEIGVYVAPSTVSYATLVPSL